MSDRLHEWLSEVEATGALLPLDISIIRSLINGLEELSRADKPPSQFEHLGDVAKYAHEVLRP